MNVYENISRNASTSVQSYQVSFINCRVDIG